MREHDNNVVALQELIWNKLFKEKTLSKNLTSAGFPLDDLEQFTLEELLGLIQRLGNLEKEKKSPSATTQSKTIQILNTASKSLANWPQGLFALLQKIGDKKHKKNDSYAGLRKQFDRFYTNIFKAKIPQKKINFIHIRFIEFGETVWKKGFIDKKLYRQGYTGNKPLASINETAKLIGTTPSTVKRLVDADLIKSTVITRNGESLIAIDTNQKLPKRIKEGRSLSAREAAKYLGIPVSMLQEFRRAGIITTNYLGTKIHSFHEFDLKDFKEKILSLPETCSIDDINNQNTVSIRKMMSFKLSNKGFRKPLFEAIIAEQLPIRRQSQDCIYDILLDKKIAEDFYQAEKIRFTGGLDQAQTASRLFCSACSIHWLVNNNYLQGQQTSYGIRVPESSIDAFNKEYIFCALLAQNNNTSARKIISECKTNGVELFFALKQRTLTKQAFLKRAHIQRLKPHFNKEKTEPMLA